MAGLVKGKLIPLGGGDEIPLIRDRLVIGRRDSCDICLKYPNVSAMHAELTFKDGYWFVKDLNSTNGTKVNGHRIVGQKLLRPGDELEIAKRKFRIDYELAMGRRALEELEEEDIFSQSLLERAGLARSTVEDEEFWEEDEPEREKRRRDLADFDTW
ncbi:MAG: FHA domain-containing protein [Gemmatales bacterium]|nr:FHA domain-containing protein [Gemmatales bacterium]MDW7995622.1 FHA domain-containing protein [Gemmatales bacterium]